MALKWRSEWTNVAGRRSLSAWVADGRSVSYRIEPKGGFITIRHWPMTVMAYQRVRLSVTFYSLADAKRWADELEAGNARLDAHMLCPAYI